MPPQVLICNRRPYPRRSDEYRALVTDANGVIATSNSATLTVYGAAGVISGTFFHDYNTNGVHDPGEPGIAGQILFLDLDGSGQLKAGDPTAITDADGNYQFTGLSAGIYAVRACWAAYC